MRVLKGAFVAVLLSGSLISTNAKATSAAPIEAIFVTNVASDSVNVYPLGSNGNVPPVATISCKRQDLI